jgi:hypothetical protein
MRYASAAAFRHALEARLLDRSRRTGLSLVRLRRTVVYERLLARLLAASPNRWVLKGGLALDLRLGTRTRTTKDMDLGRQDDEPAAMADLRRAQSLELGDYFVFAIERTDDLDDADEGVSVRYRVQASLAARRFETVTVDVGFSPPSASVPEVLSGTDLLAFADLPHIAVPTLPLEQHVAEKVHAYTRRYGAAAVPSTRVKDLIDLVLICTTSDLPARALRDALEETFATRATHPLPPALPPPPADWGAPYARMAQELGLDPDVSAAHALAARFLDPVLAAAPAHGAIWQAPRQVWAAPGTA